MSHEDFIIQAPRAIETADLHFKSLSKLKLFDGNELSFDSNTSLLAVSQYYGLIFVGTSNGFLILKSQEVFSVGCSNEYHQKEVLLNSRTTHLAISFEQKHLAVGCQTKMGPVIYIYDIGTFLTKGVSPVKTVPLSKPFQNPVIQICELMWQPNNFSGLTVCFSDGSVSSLSLFQGTGNDIFSLPNTTQARCLCWSPKGKQIVIGCNDGTLSQYKPDLKFIKKLPVPPIFNGSVSVVNVLWISSFQFVAGYKDHRKYEEFPLIVVINAQKNEPIKYINYDDVTFSMTFFRNHQLYFYHLSAWNIIFLASANSIEVAVLHGKEDNSVWEQWLLGDDSRAELPLNAEKVETFPVGIALDFTSDQAIPWGEESLPPAPRLLLLSSEGLLTTFSILNMCKNHPLLTHPPKETFDDSWFTLKENNYSSLKMKTNQPSTGTSVSETNSSESTKPMQALEVGLNLSSPADIPLTHPHLFAYLGYNNFYSPYIKEQGAFPSQQMIVDQQPLPSPLFPSNVGASGDRESGQGCMSRDGEFVKKSDQSSNASNASVLTPKESINFKDAKENLGLLEEPKQMVKFNESPDMVQTSSTSLSVGGENAPPSTAANLSADQNVSNKNLTTSPSRSAPDIMAVSSEIYVKALTDEIDHFDAELKDVLSRVSAVRAHIGPDEEKLNFTRLIGKLNDVEKSLRDTTSSQKNEIHTIRNDIIEAFAWLEDARSRNRQRKSWTYIQLKKSESLDPMTNCIMKEISDLKYYIENQLKQLHTHLTKEWMEHEKNCMRGNKKMMTEPFMEELYKTMLLEVHILVKLRANIEELNQRVAERDIKVRSHLALVDDSVTSCSKPVDDGSRTSELHKLADNLLQIKIGRDEADVYLKIAEAIHLTTRQQINEIVERSKKLTISKRNILREAFCDREIMRTRAVKPKSGSSRFIRNLSGKVDFKYFTDFKSSDTEEAIKTGNKQLGVEGDNGTAEKLLQSTFEQEEQITSAKSVDENKVDTREIPVTEQSSTFVPGNLELSKDVIGFGTASLPNKSEIGNASEFTFAGQPDPISTSSTATETTKNESKTAPFVFKAAPVFSSGPSGPQSQKSSTATSGIGLNTGNAHAVVVSANSGNTSVFAFKATDFNSTASAANSYTLPTVKTSSSFSPKVCTSFSSPSEVPAVMQENLIPHPSDNKTSATTSTTIPIFSFSSSNNTSASSTVTAPSSSSTSVFKFTTSAGSVFKFTTSTGSFSFSSPSNSSKTNTEVPTPTFSITSPALSIAFTNVTTSSDTTSAGTDNVELSSKSNLTLKALPDTNYTEVNPEKVGSGPRLNEQESILSTTTATATSVTVTNVTASTISDIGQTITAVTTSWNTPANEGKTQSENGKFETKENMGGNSVTASNAIKLEKSTSGSSPGKTEASNIAMPVFPQQPATQVFTGTTAVGDAVSSTSCSTPSTTSVSFGVPGKGIFSQSISVSTTSSIFPTAGSSIFSSAKPVTTNAALFSATPTVTASSSSIFGHSVTVAATASTSPFIHTPTTSTTSSFVQSGKDEVGKTTALFGDMLRSGLSTGSVFETPSTSVSGNIFGESSFDKSSSSIFGNAGTTVTPATTAAGLFENTSNNIFMKSSFGQIPSSSLSNVFGQPQRENTTFFGQNICSPFGSTTTTPNQNPFASPTGFSSRPVFGQNLFGQSNTGQNALERSSTTSIFGNSSTSGPSGGNIFQMGSSSFSTSSPTPFSNPQSTSPATSAFQKPMAGGFGGSPVFGSGLATTGAFGAPPTFGGASTFGSSASFGSSQKIFGSPQGTFGQNQPNFEALTSEGTDGFADLAQRSQSQTFGGNTFNQNTTFGGEPSFGGKSFSNWRS